jgi:hypothetical protein
LGYALTHSQLRSCVEALLRQQGDNKQLGRVDSYVLSEQRLLLLPTRTLFPWFATVR